MKEGLVIKGYGGFYYVQAEGKVWCCRGRGRLRLKQSLMTGDRVLFTPLDQENGVIEEIRERENSLQRPPVANIDQVILVVSLDKPTPDLKLLNRTLVACESEKLKIIIVFNKMDLVDEQVSRSLEGIYGQVGYHTVFVSALEGDGVEQLRQIIKGKISVLSGPSGVGKSTLLNSLDSSLSLKTQGISKKLKRGRHTTRYVELIAIGDGFVADTPGFSNLELPSLERTELANCFPEMRQYFGQCRFQDCIHLDEPGCAIKDALNQGLINKMRYDDYKQFMWEIIDKERTYK